ncbi:imidazoleglycerol-phosphate dehydratase HisB [Spirochaeta cellobiosiphila]|uniref:imidazoleglycerol-phosphate dehydratase HisB n=1 Tax=Spirochaeta cellobiosiphila TaxID=504483 RepID=UPI00048D8CB1|nr:imidazoleglycerol-phosphate dehydratase HisB [Spirochaeta cellobiosiphila]
MNSLIQITRKTKETDIDLTFSFDNNSEVAISTSVPFLDHMLTAMAFHGNFSLKIRATGDTEVDYHHLVEDVGLVLGDAFSQWQKDVTRIQRYGDARIPMDEALSTVVIDVCNRPTLVYKADYPQAVVGTFDMALFREFFLAFVQRSAIALHLNCVYGENSHHMIEALFKAFGKALKKAYAPLTGDESQMSTKGSL